MEVPQLRFVPRAKGSPKLARKAIAEFIESNIPRFSGWLEQIAGGIPVYDQHGVPLLDSKGSIVWLVKPDPATAMKLVADVCEYHLPRLSRATVEATVQVDHVDIHNLSALPLEQLKAMAIERMGPIMDIVDVELVEPAALPAWLGG